MKLRFFEYILNVEEQFWFHDMHYCTKPNLGIQVEHERLLVNLVFEEFVEKKLNIEYSQEI